MANPGQQARIPGYATWQGIVSDEVLQRAKDFFVYSADFVGTNNLPASATRTVSIAIQADSDFLIVVCNRTTIVTGTPATEVTFTPVLATIKDSGSGRDLMDRPVHLEALAGDGQLPGYWPFPKFMRRSSTLQTTLQNLDGANAYDVRVSYLGFKLFDFPAG